MIPKQLCELWLELSGADVQLNKELVNISKSHNIWQLDFTDTQLEFDIVIFAGAYKLFDNIDYLRNIPVFPSQGQLTLTEKVADIDITAMEKGYVIPGFKNNTQIIGATFRDNDDTAGDIRDIDTQENLNHTNEIFDNNVYTNENVIDSRVSTRCVTSDHLPLVGRLVDYQIFKDTFYKPLSKGYPKSKMPTVKYAEGLYLSSGFGSKGLCSSLVSAGIVSNIIFHNSQQISDKLLNALSPQRFWIRQFKKCL